jgi:hypothetical protein
MNSFAIPGYTQRVSEITKLFYTKHRVECRERG